ncbi:MFS transporter [Nocardioides sp. GCM10028917]|uniref:MFS transporter n=1 Tax=Nocardioides sp. GCM10028917 TaxID=3273408 RepID=UPI003613DC98
MSHTLTASTPSGQPAPDRRTLTRVCTAVLLGSALEWYDYFLYGAAAALVFGQVFFPTASESTSLLLSLATFGVGFVARPIGAMVFGHIGDKHGRRPALIATLMLMGLSTTAMALIPSHAMIGMAAPLLLVVLRLLQGMGSGAEYSGASVYAVEYAPPGRRGLFGSFSAAGVYLGLVLSSGALLLTTSLTTDAQFAAWGWRLPFLASLLLIALGLWIRLRLEETPAFEEATEDVAPAKAPLLTLVRTQWRSMLLVMGLVAAPLSFSHLYQVFALSYMADAGYDRVTGTTGLLVAGLVVMITAPLAGIASDRFGRRPVLMVGAVYAIAFAFPFFMLVDSGRPVLAMLALALAQGGSVGIMFGVQGVILSELFSTASRYSGAAVSREFAAIIFGGFAPLIAVSLAASANGASWPVGIYVVVLAAITFVSALLAPETYRTSLSDGDAAAPAPVGTTLRQPALTGSRDG